MPLFLAFFIVSLIEIGLFITVGDWLGVWPTLGLVLLSAIAGSTLLRRQGLAILAQLRGDVASARLPARPLFDGALIVAAGILLVTPGFLTDALGLALFLPPLRDRLWAALKSRVELRAFAAAPRPDHPRTRRDAVVELDPDEYRSAPNPNSPWKGE